MVIEYNTDEIIPPGIADRSIFVLVFAVNNRTSFRRMGAAFDDQLIRAQKTLPAVLIGTNIDKLPSSGIVPNNFVQPGEFEDYARLIGNAPFFGLSIANDNNNPDYPKILEAIVKLKK